jgi:hypothetical protein
MSKTQAAGEIDPKAFEPVLLTLPSLAPALALEVSSIVLFLILLWLLIRWMDGVVARRSCHMDWRFIGFMLRLGGGYVVITTTISLI